MANPNIWAPGQSVSANANSSIRDQAFTASASQTVFTLTSFTYSVGTGSLYVYVSGLMQRPGIDFLETGSDSFTLTTPVPAGTIVLAIAMVEVSAVLDQSTGMVEIYHAVGGESLIPVHHFSYTPTSGRLQVFRNGLIQTVADDYTETSSNSITLVESLDVGEKIKFMIN